MRSNLTKEGAPEGPVESVFQWRYGICGNGIRLLFTFRGESKAAAKGTTDKTAVPH